MACDKLLISDNYAFFRKFDNYKNLLEDFKEHHSTSENITKGCSSFSNDAILSKIPSTKEICTLFKYLYNKLSNRNKSGIGTANLDSNDYAFMNYWLNGALKGSNIDCSKYIKQLYQKLKAAHEDFFTKEFVESKINNIEFRDLENIKILIELYNYKDEINSMFSKIHIGEENSASFLKHTRLFNDKYKEVIINCIDDCPDFYNALELLKCKYNEEIVEYASSQDSELFAKMNPLQDYKSVFSEHLSEQNKKVITISIVFHLFGLLLVLFFSNMVKEITYFTPFRQVLSGKVKRLRNMWNAESESKNLLISSFDDENINSDNDEYNIGYYSERNS
ncbi:PIR Superfamily Protein [Plasmodium ovale wallikeri]|uniref:PIR Superfamily Protein n=1 Tax=Plasmodium ovale wallikeri TaxID=864142 RepID=A0A1A9AGI0_PLAOA|nr:PIR Superfamily Protein [Plasmodium ovale wallikeri]SBT59189.1 PIR Superfamily Protein [Plasmodium ovale wallikeri]